MITRITIPQTGQLSVTELGYLERRRSSTFVTAAEDCAANAKFYGICVNLLAAVQLDKEYDPVQLCHNYFNHKNVVIKEYTKNKKTYSFEGITVTWELKNTQFIS